MTEPQQSMPESPASAPHRRTVLGAAAWALPVLALAVAAPAAAASGEAVMTAMPATLSVSTVPTPPAPALTVTLPGVTERTPITIVLSGLKWADTGATASRTFLSYASGVFVVFGDLPKTLAPGYEFAWDDDGGAPGVIGVAAGSGTLTFSAAGYDDLAVPVTISQGAPPPGGGDGGTGQPPGEPPGSGGGGGGDIRP